MFVDIYLATIPFSTKWDFDQLWNVHVRLFKKSEAQKDFLIPAFRDF